MLNLGQFLINLFGIQFEQVSISIIIQMQNQFLKYVHHSIRKNNTNHSSKILNSHRRVSSIQARPFTHRVLNEEVSIMIKNFVNMKKGSLSERKIKKEYIETKHQVSFPSIYNPTHSIQSHPRLGTNSTDTTDKRQKKSWLSKALRQKKTFAEEYFKQIQVTRQKIKQKSIDHTLPEIKIGNCTVKGYIYQGAVILKAQDGVFRATKKFIYEKVKSQMDADYKSWVQSKFIEQ